MNSVLLALIEEKELACHNRHVLLGQVAADFFTFLLYIHPVRYERINKKSIDNNIGQTSGIKQGLVSDGDGG